ILGTFLLGMATVVVAIPFEHIANLFLPNYSLGTLFAWAAIEEIVKFGAAYMIALRTRFNCEPIDATIYLITAALGFAALENVLFLLGPLADGDFTQGIVTINMRFIGATLLHVVCSGVIGVFMGLAFYKGAVIRKILTIAGVIVAIILHTLFNSFIIKSEHNILVIFSGVWIGLVLVILILEHIKKIKRIHQ
ncbi:MAG TPA: PrsW family glutamic-type intramembrane protease, partial [Candidatus Paceibacterota bacterium]|nr:PrsW family glutamic-type intramembrane protease [Candidatus Paceibacterota bacterium]